MATKFQLEKTLLVLVVLTALAIVGRDQFLLQTFTIAPGEGFDVRLYDDSPAGGNSSAQLLQAEGDAYEWRCHLRTRYQYPHCGFEVRFNEPYTQGYDLSDYRTVRMWLEYTGPNNTVRAFLRNYDPRYSQADDDTTTKYNQVEFIASDPKGYYEFNFSDFFVANWWLLEKGIPPQLSHPQFDNIVGFEIQTGSGHKPGEHHFRLARVELVGQRFNTADWYLAIILVWSVLIVGFLIFRVFKLTGEVRERKVREQELIEVNSLLDSRSRELETIAKTDPLTGAFNRQGIEEAIKNGLFEWRHARKPLSIVMMDIDHFKKVNDTHGHGVGDEVLTGVSNLVKEHIRSTDLFARWGGEEFVLVCRNTRINYATHIAEKLRRLIADSEFTEEVGQITASFGVASLQDQTSIDQLFQAADEALYLAKKNGRNRIEVAGSF